MSKNHFFIFFMPFIIILIVKYWHLDLFKFGEAELYFSFCSWKKILIAKTQFSTLKVIFLDVRFSILATSNCCISANFCSFRLLFFAICLSLYVLHLHLQYLNFEHRWHCVPFLRSHQIYFKSILQDFFFIFIFVCLRFDLHQHLTLRVIQMVQIKPQRAKFYHCVAMFRFDLQHPVSRVQSNEH